MNEPVETTLGYAAHPDFLRSENEVLSIQDLLTKAAQTHGNYPAFVEPGQPAITYRRLAATARKIGESLAECGYGRTDRIAMWVPNGTSQALALLGACWSTTAVPINAAATPSEVCTHIERTQARALIVATDVEREILLGAAALGIPVYTMQPLPFTQDEWVMLLTGNSRRSTTQIEDIVPSGDDVALLLATSGTTARSKLVPLTHARLMRIAQTYAQLFELDEHDCCLELMPFVHTHGIFSLLSALYAKSRVACMPSFRTDLFFQWLELLEPTWYTAVPTIHQAILAEVTSYPKQVEESALRFIRSSASHFSQNVIESIERVWHSNVIETYGLTEASLTTISLPHARKIGAVGRQASAGVEIMIADSSLNAQAAFASGEVYLRGPLVIDAYADDEQITQAAFAGQWFRTGDQGYLDADGYLFLTGRLKEMINRGGENISPQEIDEAMLKHPDIQEAVSFAFPHERLGEEVAAAIVLRPGAALSHRELRVFLAGQISGYKVPTRVSFLSHIPKGPTGKYQRNRLPVLLETELTSALTAQSEPATEATSYVEERLRGIWKEVFPNA